MPRRGASRSRARCMQSRASFSARVLRPTSTRERDASMARERRIHYYCHRKAKLSPMRDGSATAGGCFRVGCHGDRLGPLPRGCSLEYPPSCLFSAIPSPSSQPPRTSPLFPLSPSLSLLSISLSFTVSPTLSLPSPRVFLFPHIHTYSLGRSPPPLASLIPLRLVLITLNAGPFASFVLPA